MPPERPRPDLEEVREALRERDERIEETEPPPAPPQDDERDDDDG
jgi:hypothetical protein